MADRRVAVLADDLIWSTRLAGIVNALDAHPLAVRDLAGLQRLAPDVGHVMVDLTARRYDGVAAVRFAAGQGRRVLAIGQHDDPRLRRRAMAAGADRVLTYRALAERGEPLIAAWLTSDPAAADSAGPPSAAADGLAIGADGTRP